MRVVIIGYGTIGKELARKMREKDIDTVRTIDIDENKKADFQSLKDYYRESKYADVYIICVWTQKQVLSVVKEMNLNNHPLISLETACNIGTFDLVKKYVSKKADVIVFNERWNPNDDFHNIFNQTRVMGGDYKKGKEFYLRYMMHENIITTNDPRMAEICKITENAYRYVEIAIAEELKMLLKDDFEELRRLVNTKWNINILEARDGIGGPCLPKDIKLFNSYFKDNKIFKEESRANNRYKEYIK